jgi:hypothetical protein
MKSSLQESGNFKELLPDTSRQTTDIAALFLVEHPEHLPEAMQIVWEDTPAMSMRAAWVIGIAAEMDGSLPLPYLSRIIQALNEIEDEGTRRCLVKLLHGRTMHLSDRDLGILANLCFTWLESPSSAVAIKMYCMELLYEISARYPEIKLELLSIIRFLMPEGSPGIKSAGKRIISRLNREIAGSQ